MKKANISYVLLVSLVVIFAGASILMIASNGRYNAKREYDRIENRYIAESGIDLATGLFLNYLENQDYVLQYTKNADQSFSVKDVYAPYLLDEIRISDSLDDVKINLVETETADYLSSIGFLEFKNNGRIEFYVNTFGLKEKFKLPQMCIQPEFLLGEGEYNNQKSRITPIYLTVKSEYMGGEVFCNVMISNIYVVRKPFSNIEAGETGSVSAWLDVGDVVAAYNNYQNYRRHDKK